MATCESENTEAIDQSSFWDENGIHWDAHRIGWAVSGAFALAAVLITVVSVFRHARNYHVRKEQRQIIRILYMPLVYAIISWFSYRFFRAYTYYSFAVVVYEAFTISAFLLLIIQYVANTSSGKTAEGALERKDKKKLPLPFCCWRYRPTKAYFMYTIKWSVLQYVIIRPAVSITGIICEALGVLSHGTIKPTEYWTASNIADGLNALATTIEMVLFAFFMMWAYPVSEYVRPDLPKTSVGRPLIDSINFSDFAIEIWSSLRFFWDFALGKPHTRGSHKDSMDFGEAFGVRNDSGVLRTRGGAGANAADPDAVRPFFADQSRVERSRSSHLSNGVRHGSEGSGDMYGMRPLAAPGAGQGTGAHGRGVV
ncbi:hypothetical protein FS749_011701 [Ceratobasidium sp. UAMH 11750]|nr:hypothetical protein FS749_011701 [Ceratobasidium sp. UAMH 11750]